MHVRCNKKSAELWKSRFGSGSRGKSIKLGEMWMTPTEFESHCGRSASKDWKRSIRFQGQTLQILIDEGFLQVHATSCSCSVCLEDILAAGPIRLNKPYKRKKRTIFNLNMDPGGATTSAVKTLRRCVSANPFTEVSQRTAATTTVTLPVSNLDELVPGLILENTPNGPSIVETSNSVSTPQQAATQSPCSVSNSISPNSTTVPEIPLEKAWEQMNEVNKTHF